MDRPDGDERLLACRVEHRLVELVVLGDLQLGLGSLEGPGAPRPALLAWTALSDLAKARPLLRRLDLPDSDVYAYRFEEATGKGTTVVWLETGFVAPDADPAPSKVVSVPVSGDAVAAFRTIHEIPARSTPDAVLYVVAGAVEVTADETPWILVE